MNRTALGICRDLDHAAGVVARLRAGDCSEAPISVVARAGGPCAPRVMGHVRPVVGIGAAEADWTIFCLLCRVTPVVGSGIGPLIATGPITEALVACGTDALGALRGVLLALGRAPDEAERLVGRVIAGRVLVLVHAPFGGMAQEARRIIEELDAEDTPGDTTPALDRRTPGSRPPQPGVRTTAVRAAGRAPGRRGRVQGPRGPFGFVVRRRPAL